jgi:hypothetical protein
MSYIKNSIDILITFTNIKKKKINNPVYYTDFMPVYYNKWTCRSTKKKIILFIIGCYLTLKIGALSCYYWLVLKFLAILRYFPNSHRDPARFLICFSCVKTWNSFHLRKGSRAQVDL